MSTDMVTKSSGLAKTAPSVRDLAQRLERARQSRNEKIARADAEYVEAVRRALAMLPGGGADVSPTDGEPNPDHNAVPAPS